MSASDSASDRAYAAIRAQILDGTLPAETMLSEVTLASEIGVSRTPVRAALARLQDEGWIAVYPKRGALVRGMTERMVADLADARLIFEATAVQRATPAAKRRLAERLRAELEEQAQAFGDDDLGRFIDLTVAFHRSFVQVGDNQVMLDLSDRLADRQRFLLYSHGRTLIERCEVILVEHSRLVDALEADDAAAFAEILRVHLSDTHGPELSRLWPA